MPLFTYKNKNFVCKYTVQVSVILNSEKLHNVNPSVISFYSSVSMLAALFE